MICLSQMFTWTVKNCAILENKVVQKLKFSKNDNNKKPSSKLIFFNGKFFQKDSNDFSPLWFPPIPTTLCAGIHFILIGRACVAKIRVSSTYSLTYNGTISIMKSYLNLLTVKTYDYFFTCLIWLIHTSFLPSKWNL